MTFVVSWFRSCLGRLVAFDCFYEKIKPKGLLHEVLYIVIAGPEMALCVQPGSTGP